MCSEQKQELTMSDQFLATMSVLCSSLCNYLVTHSHTQATHDYMITQYLAIFCELIWNYKTYFHRFMEKSDFIKILYYKNLEPYGSFKNFQKSFEIFKKAANYYAYNVYVCRLSLTCRSLGRTVPCNFLKCCSSCKLGSHL